MWAKVPGATLFYRDLGEGTPIVALHGGLGLDHCYLEVGLAPLAASTRLLLYDLSGNGRSTEPETWSSVEHETWAAELEALRHHLSLDRFVLFGHSYGGYIAMEYAVRHPERLLGLILCSTVPAFDYPDLVFENARRRGTLEQVAALQEALAAPLPDDAAFERVWKTLLPLYFHRWDPDLAARAFEGTRYRVGAFNRAFFHCLPRYDVREHLRGLEAPTLVVGGEDDWITPPSQGADRLCALLPNARREIFGACGHFPFFEAPDRFSEILGGWLAERGL